MIDRDEKKRQNRQRPGAPDLHPALTIPHLERAQRAEFHRPETKHCRMTAAHVDARTIRVWRAAAHWKNGTTRTKQAW
ncbi:hypothetical protein GCM10027569_37830 [Flindersiella endophytica]